MRIGEVAVLAAVTPRAVRHHHHVGLLPEPVRRSNGYRDYGMREAVLLARIRRLSELGLGLGEIHAVLADTEGHDLAEIVRDLDADLARQQDAIRQRRRQLAPLRNHVQAGHLSPEGPVPPERTDPPAAFGDADDSPGAAKDREHLRILDAATPQGTSRSQGDAGARGAIYALLDALTGQRA
ncbi:helix-turn-helix domain-containing protein [Streptomyces xanthophaeus]